MIITGDFETHLTVASPEALALGDLRAFASQAGLKVTHIVLQCGRQPSQLMLTRHSSGTLDETLQAAHALAASLAARGLGVRRVKIEVDALHPAAPSDKHEAETKPEDWHFEQHVKVLLPSLSDLESVSEIARRNAAHLSRNAFCARPDGKEERFLTQRFYAMGRAEAWRTFDTLTLDLERNGFTILDRETEYVVFDSNVTLDAGWLEAPERTSKCSKD